jgi:3-dehydroquinate synthase
MKTLTVGLPGNEYDIVIRRGLLDDVGVMLKGLNVSNEPVAVVTDTNVWNAHGEKFSASLSVAGVAFSLVILPPGEGNKSMSGLSGLYDAFAGMGLSRGGLVAAFGGGVVGDLCGFAAATWMRGVRFAQVPTTLLAQVDSSVGGKTAINLAQGKNLVGAFYQPKLVAIDPDMLSTLPARELRSGMAEVLKYGAIRSKELFDALAEMVPDSPPLDLSETIYECCRIKSEIVSCDERDFGERMLLNFGHTLGHAIEKATAFERYNHGEAVAFGMILAADAGERMSLSVPGTADSLRKRVAACGLETDYPGDAAGLLPILTSDKKSERGGVRMVFLRRIGEAFTRFATFPEIQSALKSGRA